MNNPFLGTGVALVTPFNEDHSIDTHALRKLVRYQVENGTDFLVVQGTTGESPVLTWEEKMRTLEVVLEENNGQLKVVFGIGGNNTRMIGETMNHFSKNVDGILSVSPYYNKPMQRGIIEHYRHLAECTELPIILYNVPGRTGSNMHAETTLELAEIPNIVAMKEASGNFEQIMELVRLKPNGFSILSGDDALTLPMIATGVEGVISVVANAFPKKFSKMVNACLKDDFRSARKEHLELLPITRMFFEQGNPGGVKVALEKMGMMKQMMRPPLYAVSKDLAQQIEHETDRLLNQ